MESLKRLSIGAIVIACFFAVFYLLPYKTDTEAAAQVGQFHVKADPDIPALTEYTVRLATGQTCRLHPTEHIFGAVLLSANISALLQAETDIRAGRPTPDADKVWFPEKYRIENDRLYLFEQDGITEDGEYTVSDCQ